METPTHTFDPPDLFAFVIAHACSLVELVGLKRGVPEPLLVLIWRRIRRLGRQFARLVERHRAGGLPDVAPALRRSTSPPPEDLRVRAPSLLPRQRGWLLRLLPETEGASNAIYWMFKYTDIKALVAEAPELGRSLRPICLMLGVDMPTWLRLPRRARARKLLETSAPAEPPAPAQPQHDDDWPQWRGPGKIEETLALFGKVLPKKPA